MAPEIRSSGQLSDAGHRLVSLSAMDTSLQFSLLCTAPIMVFLIFSQLGFQELATTAPSLTDSTSSAASMILAPSDASLRTFHSCSVPHLVRECIIPGDSTKDYLQQLPFGTTIETLSPGGCITVTSDSINRDSVTTMDNLDVALDLTVFKEASFSLLKKLSVLSSTSPKSIASDPDQLKSARFLRNASHDPDLTELFPSLQFCDTHRGTHSHLAPIFSHLGYLELATAAPSRADSTYYTASFSTCPSTILAPGRYITIKTDSISGIQSSVSPLPLFSCDVEKMFSSSCHSDHCSGVQHTTSGSMQPVLVRLMIRNAILQLRNNGFSTLALDMKHDIANHKTRAIQIDIGNLIIYKDLDNEFLGRMTEGTRRSIGLFADAIDGLMPELTKAFTDNGHYQTPVHDVLGLKLNRLSVQGEKGGMRSYVLDSSDSFPVANGSLEFPEVAMAIDVNEVNKRTGGTDGAGFDGTDLIGNTKHLMNAVNSLPELTERTQVIDKLRIAIVYLIGTESINQSEVEAVELTLRQIEVDTAVFHYVKKIKSLNVSLASANSASRNNIVDWADTLYGQSISAVTVGVENLLSNDTASIDRTVEALTEGRPNPAIYSYLAFNPRAPKSVSGAGGSHLKGPFEEAVLFMIGGGLFTAVQVSSPLN